MKHYLNDEILNHTLQILHQESPHRATRHVLPMFIYIYDYLVDHQSPPVPLTPT